MSNDLTSEHASRFFSFVPSTKWSSVKISEAFEFETETAVGWRSDLPENVIWQVDSLQI
jgi:hypothetical protein